MSLVKYAIGEKYKLTLSYLIDKNALMFSEEIEEKYNKLIKNNYSNEQENKVD